MAVRIKLREPHPNTRRYVNRKPRVPRGRLAWYSETCHLGPSRNLGARPKTEAIEMKKTSNKKVKNVNSKWRHPLHYHATDFREASCASDSGVNYARRLEREYNSIILKVPSISNGIAASQRPERLIGATSFTTDFRKSRSASVDVSSSSRRSRRNPYPQDVKSPELTSPCRQELDSFFESIHLYSSEPPKDKRSRSLDVSPMPPRTESIRRGIPSKEIKETRNSNTFSKRANSVIELDLDNISSSTDIEEESPCTADRHVSFAYPVKVDVEIHPQSSPRFPECLRRQPTFSPLGN